MRRILGLLLALSAAGASGGAAQDLATGAVLGRVVDEAGVPVREVRVALGDVENPASRAIDTDADGYFRFLFLPPGEYDLTIEKLGYTPRRLFGVPVAAAEETMLTLAIRGLDGPADRVVDDRFAGASQARSTSISGRQLERLPLRERTLLGAARYGSRFDQDGGVEGLPAWMTSTSYDGAGLVRPGFDVGLSALRGVDLVAGGTDVEWSGAAGGHVNGYARRGSDQGIARATWAGDALPGAADGTDGAAFTDMRGEIAGGGGFDRGDWTAGIDVRRAADPLTAPWDARGADLIAYGDAQGVELDGYGAPLVRTDDRITGFGAANVAFGRDHRLALRLLGGTSSARLEDVPYPDSEAQHAMVGGVLRSTLGPAWWNQLRLSVQHGRSLQPALPEPPLTLVSEGLSTALRAPSEVRANVLALQNALGWIRGAHALKFGVSARITRHRLASPFSAAGTYAFGGLDELVAGEGVLVRTEGSDEAAEWTSVEYGVFAQDRWRPAAGLELTAGLRAERETLPRSDVRLDAEWLRLTGVANNAPDQAGIRLSPRAALRWTPEGAPGWLLEASGGVHYGRLDPRLVAQWHLDDGANRVRRVVGDVTWPPTDAAGGISTIRLTVLAPDFDAPRSSRVEGGLTRALGTTALSVHGAMRRTVNLPRRTDLNLLPGASGRDQYGAPVFGTLVQQGALIVAEPGSNRRFGDYDEVAVFASDGTSDYWGVTLGATHVSEPLELFASYTYSSTRDDWFGAGADGSLPIRPSDVLTDDRWVDGVSDFDVPHRGVAGAAVALPFGLRLAGVYRAESGRPFTPGFRRGVDANGDGDAVNDPAFVDPSIPGMDALLGEWPCLRASEGAVAERNGCRGEAVHRIDARLDLRLGQAAGMSAALVVEGFDLLDAERIRPDAALLLVDPDGTLVTDGTGSVTLPLVANPDFGTPGTFARSGRGVRIGLLLNW